MKHYEIVDEFIGDTCDQIGATFTVDDLRTWGDPRYPGVNWHQALQAHRQHPEDRVFTTHRIGLGPHAFYEVVETTLKINGRSVGRLQAQMATEFAKHWRVERECRMDPIVARSGVARRALNTAEARMRLVAATLEVELEDLGLDEDDHQNGNGS